MRGAPSSTERGRSLPRGERLLSLVHSIPAPQRDAFVERLLGIRDPTCDASPPARDLIGYHPSGFDAIVRCLEGLALRARTGEVFVDVGAGLGKVVLLAHLLTGIRAVGIELQERLVERARQRARALGADVAFEHGDARRHLPEGTVYFLYTPAVGAALDAVMDRLRERAAGRTVTVCALGTDLSRYDWLEPCEPTDFWLSSYRVVAPPRSR